MMFYGRCKRGMSVLGEKEADVEGTARGWEVVPFSGGA